MNSLELPTLRDKFAMLALNALLSSDSFMNIQIATKRAYEIADLMMAERGR